MHGMDDDDDEMRKQNGKVRLDLIWCGVKSQSMEDFEEGRSRRNMIPPSIEMRTMSDDGSTRGVDEVVSGRNVVEIRESEGISGKVLGGTELGLVHVQNILKLVEVGLDDRLVGLFALKRSNVVLVDDGRDEWVIALRLHLTPHSHQTTLFFGSDPALFLCISLPRTLLWLSTLPIHYIHINHIFQLNSFKYLAT